MQVQPQMKQQQKPSRRSNRIRNAPVRFGDEKFATTQESSAPVIPLEDHSWYDEIVDDNGRLWELNLNTGERTLLYDPSQYIDYLTGLHGHTETKEPDKTMDKLVIIFEMSSIQSLRYPDVDTYTMEATDLPEDTFDQFESNGAFSRAMDDIVLPILNTAVQEYRTTVSSDKYDSFTEHGVYILTAVLTGIHRKGALLPNSTATLLHTSPVWGKTITFDGSVFHFPFNCPTDNGLQKNISLVIDTDVSKVKNDIPSDIELEAANTLMGFRDADKVRVSDTVDQLPNTTRGPPPGFTDKALLGNIITPPTTVVNQNKLYKQTYQIFNIDPYKESGGEFKMHTDSLFSPLTNLQYMWLKNTDLLKSGKEYLLFNYTNANYKFPEMLAIVYWDIVNDCYDIILYNNQIDYHIDNFRKNLWWEFGNTVQYKISVVTDMEKAFSEATYTILNQNKK